MKPGLWATRATPNIYESAAPVKTELTEMEGLLPRGGLLFEFCLASSCPS